MSATIHRHLVVTLIRRLSREEGEGASAVCRINPDVTGAIGIEIHKNNFQSCMRNTRAFVEPRGKVGKREKGHNRARGIKQSGQGKKRGREIRKEKKRKWKKKKITKLAWWGKGTVFVGESGAGGCSNSVVEYSLGGEYG